MKMLVIVFIQGKKRGVRAHTHYRNLNILDKTTLSIRGWLV